MTTVDSQRRPGSVTEAAHIDIDLTAAPETIPPFKPKKGERCPREIWADAFGEHKRSDGPRGLLHLAVAAWIGLQARADATHAVMSVVELARVTGKSERTVKRALDELKAEEWLSVRRRGGRRGDGTTEATEYDLTIPPSLQATYRWPFEASSTGHPGWPVEAISTGHMPSSTGHGRAQNVDPQVSPGRTNASTRTREDRAEAIRQARRDHLAAIADEPPCEHGEPGGNVAQLGTDWVRCAMCRKARKGARS